MNTDMDKKKNKVLQSGKVIMLLLALYDIIAVNISYFLALWVRFDGRYSAIPEEYLTAFKRFAPFYTILCIIIFIVFKLYNSIWQFASYVELLHLMGATMVSAFVQIIGTMMLMQGGRMPLSYYLGGMMFQGGFLLLARFGYRFIHLERRHRGGDENRSNVLIFGAGENARLLSREITHSKEISDDRVVCFLDDDPNKWNKYIDGVPVVGGRHDVFKAVEDYKVKKIYLAIPSASAQAKRDIINICTETGCEIKQLPGIYQVVRGDVKVSRMRDISVEDLLGREPLKADLTEVFRMIQGKVVLVTGGGGSIGSELCRQIAGHSPRQLIIFDIYENNAYDIQFELKEKYPDLDLVVLIGSVRDSRKIYQVFEQYRPQLVYHAAAHKHVPLMEDSPCEAIKNNTIGTYKTAYAAMVHGCERFVLISTDKAVNPTNIMGASKRLCEMIIQSFDQKVKEGKAAEIPQLFTHTGKENSDKGGTGKVFQDIKTEFVAVRFGNVLGSNGSVIPLFRKQIAKGGPVTVTHPDIIRYFMTIPEAVSLVLTAGSYAHGGEIFVLDMGSPVKIADLARNLIRLSGFKPDVDIKIEYTGLRPGEKLYEEKLMAEEGLKKTASELVHIGMPIPFETDTFLKQLDKLMIAAYQNKSNIRELVAEAVTTYHPEADAASKGIDATYMELVAEDDQ